ncbi:hypothetical protein [Vannielia sp.]
MKEAVRSGGLFLWGDDGGCEARAVGLGQIIEPPQHVAFAYLMATFLPAI